MEYESEAKKGKIKLERVVLSCNQNLDEYIIEDKQKFERACGDRTFLLKSFGAISSKYSQASHDEQIEYWIKVFNDLRNSNCIPRDEEEYINNFIKMRTEFEDKILGQRCFLLPRFKSENIDKELKEYIQNIIIGYNEPWNPWFRDTATYWNYKKRNFKEQENESVFRIQNMSEAGILCEFDNNLLHLDWRQLKDYRKVSFTSSDYESIMQIANYGALMLNKIEKLENEIKELKLKLMMKLNENKKKIKINVS